MAAWQSSSHLSRRLWRLCHLASPATRIWLLCRRPCVETAPADVRDLPPSVATALCTHHRERAARDVSALPPLRSVVAPLCSTLLLCSLPPPPVACAGFVSLGAMSGRRALKAEGHAGLPRRVLTSETFTISRVLDQLASNVSTSESVDRQALALKVGVAASTLVVEDPVAEVRLSLSTEMLCAIFSCDPPPAPLCAGHCGVSGGGTQGHFLRRHSAHRCRSVE